MLIKTSVNKQILHGLSLNTKIYSPDLIIIQQSEAEMNITTPKVNKFDVQRKYIQYLLCYILIICNYHAIDFI